ncbi:MAG: ATP-binding protein [Myxococcota bacterium]
MRASPSKLDPREVKQIRIGYIIGLTFLGGLTVLGQLIIQSTLADQRDDAEIINVAGRQRMLSQRLAKNGVLLVHALDPEERALIRLALSNDLDEWTRAHERLTRGDLAAFVNAATPTQLRELESQQRALANAILSAPETSEAEAILAAESRFLPTMNAIVFAYSAQSEDALGQTRAIEMVLAALTILVLLIEAFLVFRPLVQRVRGLVSRLRGVSDRLAASEARYARAAEGAEHGVWDWSIDDQELYWSAQFRRLAGLRDHENGWDALLHRLLPAHQDAFRHALEASPKPIDVEFRVLIEGRPRWLRLRGRAPDGDPSHVAGTLTDIDEPRRLKAERERLLRYQDQTLQDTREDLARAQMLSAVGTLAAGIAHDFNNYLQVIKLTAAGLTPNESASVVIAAADDASLLARQLLSIRKGHAGEVLAPVDVAHVVRDTLPVIENLLPPEILLRARFPGKLPPVLADTGQLRQVILNLCLNARDAMPEGGELSLSLRSVESRDQDGLRRKGVEFCVEDQGVGMTAEVQRRVFEPFYSTKQQREGAGLGLPMVDGIIRRHGGAVTLESAPGHGTVVRVWIPSVDRPLPSEPPPPKGEHRSLEILLVEDHEAIQRMLRRVLQADGHRVRVYSTGAEALAANLATVDLLICDVMLPDILGTELVQTIRRQRDSSLPVLLVSGYSERAIDTEMPDTAFLQKPFGMHDLRRVVARLMGQSEPAPLLGP